MKFEFAHNTHFNLESFDIIRLDFSDVFEAIISKFMKKYTREVNA